MLTALSHNGDWVKFDINDVPITFSDNEFVLWRRKNSPILLLDSIRRGEPNTDLFEGDIIEFDNDQWLVCYERGFYVINSQYVSKYFYELPEYKKIGTIHSMTFPVSMTGRSKHLFKYEDTIFRLHDIIGVYKDGLILRCVSKPIPTNDIHQECCVTYNKNRVYLEDKLDDGVILMKYGRITLFKDNIYTDITTGGVI